jgi:hypothetical protein
MRSRLAAIPALLLVVVAVWEIVVTRRSAASVPGDDAWNRASAIVRERHEPGDLIVVAPAWADPILRLHLGDLIPIDMAARMDAARYGTIWELSLDRHGASAPEVAGLVSFDERDAGGIFVRRYERVPATVLADLRDRGAAGASVDLVEVAFEPHRCVVATVVAGKPARIKYPKLPLGSELVGYVGIADVFTRRESREPIDLALAIDGKRLTTATAPIDRWVGFRAATIPGVGDVELELSWAAARLPVQLRFDKPIRVTEKPDSPRATSVALRDGTKLPLDIPLDVKPDKDGFVVSVGDVKVAIDDPARPIIDRMGDAEPATYELVGIASHERPAATLRKLPPSKQVCFAAEARK